VDNVSQAEERRTREHGTPISDEHALRGWRLGLEVTMIPSEVRERGPKASTTAGNDGFSSTTGMYVDRQGYARLTRWVLGFGLWRFGVSQKLNLKS
jgi:hypothetical protein